MKKLFGKSIGRTQRSRLNRLRQLKMESLEGRQLMAADVAPNHNYLIPEDVNGDFRVSPLDALIVINKLNNRFNNTGAAEGEGDGNKAFWDVKPDQKLSPLDALVIINRLNGEGEGDFLMRYSYSFTAFNSASPTNPLAGNPITQVTVGSDFWVNVFMQDIRRNSIGTISNVDRGPNGEIRITASGTGLLTGDRIVIEGVTGTTEANGTWNVTVLSPSTFTLDGSTFTNNYVRGGNVYKPRGIFSGGIDLGVSDLTMASYVQPTTEFRSGVRFSTDYRTFSDAFRGGGIVLGAGNSPSASDGQIFTLTTSAGSRTFEFDTNSSVAQGNVPVVLTSASSSYSQVATAVIDAINSSGLGITGTFNRFDTVILSGPATFSKAPSDQTALSFNTTSTDFFDEVSGGWLKQDDDGNIVEPGPDQYRFFSVRFSALKPGQLSFNPNGPDNVQAENTLFGGDALPNNLVDFGSAFSINIVSDPSGPTANTDTITVTEDIPRTITAAELLANDTSGATPPRALSLVSIQTIGSTQGTLSGNTYTPASNSNATDVLTYTVRDTSGLQSTGTISINITPVNDNPTAVNDSFTAVAGSVDNDYAVLANDSVGPANESSQELTITGLSTPSNGGTVSIAPGGKSILYTPDPAYVGDETFTYTVRDTGTPAAEPSTATVTVNVQPLTRPFARRDLSTVVEDSTDNRINVLTNDLTNAGQTAVLVGVASQPVNGRATVDGSSILYTPNSNFFGTDIFTYNMTETNGTATSLGTVTVTVNNVNDRPVLVNDPAAGVTIATEENAILNIPFASLTGNDSPGANETDTLTVTTVTPLTTGGFRSLSIDPNTRTVVYDPAPNFFGTFLFTYNATDNGVSPLSALEPATVAVTVNPFNDPPVLTTKSFTGTEDQNVTMAISAVLANDSPGPGETTSQSLNVTSVAAVTPNAGTVEISGSNVIYRPAQNFNGAFVYTYTATDTGVPAKSSTATVTVNMSAVNDAPVPTSDTVRAFKNNRQRIPFASLLSNDSVGATNEAGQTLTITSVQAAVNGTVSLDPANSVVIFDPRADFTGTASFTYTVQDNGGGATNSAVGSVTVNVEEFLPSTIGGTVWVDETKDGAIANNERKLAGVRVQLTGTSLGQPVTQESITLNDGTYEFDELGPGSYQITFSAPMFSQASSIHGVGPYNFTIAEPGGFDIVQNYSVFGIDPVMVTRVGRLMDQLVSKFQNVDQSIALRGGFFAIGSDNSLSWGIKMAGFDDALYTEAVFDGDWLLVTVVDGNHQLKTYRVSSQFYAFVSDAQGNKLVRLLGGQADFANVVPTSLTNPAYTARNYLASVEEVFDSYDF